MNNIVRWQPFDDVVSLRDAMNGIMQESFVRPRAWLAPMGGMDLAVDMYETDNDLVVTTALPGVKAEDVEITITGDVLCVKADTKAETREETASYFRQERRYGSCTRSVTLPVAVQADKADAKLNDGVLTLTLPKAEESKPKTIQVKA
jgi:HSP20 family protein